MTLPSKQRVSFLPPWCTRRRVLVALAACVGIVFGGLLLIVLSLDQPWVKARVQGLVLRNSGLEIDYGTARVSTRGLEVRDLLVRSPLPVRERAPELLRVARLSVDVWQPAGLVVELERPVLTLTFDEQGRTSFDWIPSPKPKEPPTPLSQLPAEVVGSLSALGALHVSDLSLVLIRTESGTATERMRFGARSLALTRKAGDAQAFELALGRPGAPSEVEFARRRLEETGAQEGFGAVKAGASLRAELTPVRLNAALTLGVVKHDFYPGVAPRAALELALEGRFDAARGRSTLRLLRADLSGTATLEGELEWHDERSPVVRRASGHVDVGKLFDLLPNGLLPLRARRGRLDLDVEGLPLDRPAQSARMSLNGELEGLELIHAASSLTVSRAVFALESRPRAAELGIRGELTLDTLELIQDAQKLRGEGLGLTLSGEGTRAFTGNAELHFRALEARGRSAFSLREGRLGAQLKDFAIQEFAAHGDVTLEGRVASLESHMVPRTSVTALELRARAPLSSPGPVAVDAELSLGRLRLFGAEGRAVVDAPARAALGVEQLRYEPSTPERSQGVARGRLELGPLSAELRLEKEVEALDFDLALNGPLTVLRALLPESIAQRAPLPVMTFDLRSSGRVGRLLSDRPELRERTTLRVERPAFDAFAADALVLELRSVGTAAHHEAHAELRAEGLRREQTALGDDTLRLDVLLDGTRPALSINAVNQGALEGELRAWFTLDRTRRTLDYDVRSALSGLTPLAPLAAELPWLNGLALDELAFQIESRGTLGGLFGDDRAGLDWTGDPRFATAESEHSIRVRNVRWADGARALSVPAAALRVTLEHKPELLSADSELSVEEATFGFGRRRLGVTDLRDRTRATLRGGFVDGDLEVAQRMTVRKIEQNLARTYPIGDVELRVNARRDGRNVLRLADLRLENAAGGTKLSMRGDLDLGETERRLSLQTSLRQDLAQLSRRRELFIGRGDAMLELAIASPDLRLFRNRATLRLERAAMKLPSRKIELTGVDGEVPIATDLVLSPKGVELLRTIQINPYAMLRFTDQHPLLQKPSFLSIERVETPLASIAPLAANIQVEQNLLSVSQLELGLRSGTVTGNGIFEFDRRNSRLHADVRASGVQSSHGERFDGNAALVVGLGDRSIEGRADILRIGARHLHDLLDVQDPGRADPALNRIRSALGLGYPERVKLSFRHGFVNAGVSFGGLARFLKLGDVRGIPIGPLMDRVVSSLNEEQQ